MQRSLQVFEESIRSEGTKEYYKRFLEAFFKFSKATDYDSLTLKDPKAVQILVEDYVMFLKKRCRLDDLNPNSVQTMLAPVFMFFEQNDVRINSKKIKRMYPEKVMMKGASPYIIAEIRKMLGVADERGKALIHFLASTGGRPAVIDDPVLRREHITDMGDDIWCFKVYAGSRQEAFIFTPPEATKAIKEYFEYRKFNGEKLTNESPIFRNPVIKTAGWTDVEPLKSHSARLIVFRILRRIGMRKKGKSQRYRYDQAILYGFRKRFDTILNKVGVKPSKKLCNRMCRTASTAVGTIEIIIYWVIIERKLWSRVIRIYKKNWVGYSSI